jgi:hypothetical protein
MHLQQTKIRHCPRLEIGREVIETCSFPKGLLESVVVPSG